MKSDRSAERLRSYFLEQSFNVLIPIVAILGALLVSGLLIAAWGANVLEAYAALFSGAFGSPNAWATTLRNWAPLVFTGLAVVYAFRAGFFNIGMEGQLYMGALAGTWVAVTFADWSGWFLIPASMLAAGLAGGLLCVIPGILKAWRVSTRCLRRCCSTISSCSSSSGVFASTNTRLGGNRFYQPVWCQRSDPALSPSGGRSCQCQAADAD